MANYTLNRTGAQIESILNHAANEWTVIEDVTLSAAESAHDSFRNRGYGCGIVAGFGG